MSFLGWVGRDELPAVLHTVDLVINPSIRGWSETFCIANIEVMAAGVPLVTFGVGGVGEYVSDEKLQGWRRLQGEGGDADSDANGNSAKDGDTEAEAEAPFTVTTNAILVHEASPEALARAARELVLSPGLRRVLGAAGRETVVRHFGQQRQMQQYEELYWLLARARRRRRRRGEEE